jgi:hypothetical protein
MNMTGTKHAPDPRVEDLDLRDEASAAGRRARRASEASIRAAASGRRRKVDPTTCDREYTPAEVEFMQAMQDYKASSGRLFPTWSEVLEVVRDIGYRKDVAAPAV